MKVKPQIQLYRTSTECICGISECVLEVCISFESVIRCRLADQKCLQLGGKVRSIQMQQQWLGGWRDDQFDCERDRCPFIEFACQKGSDNYLLRNRIIRSSFHVFSL